ncbi:growth hormone receptor b isoform X1 [Electrophorus electricus]|nr:growth hormone receptor b isoform X1 [Electrophorus electricus]
MDYAMRTHQSFCIFLLIATVTTQALQPTMQDKSTTWPHLTGCVSRELTTFCCYWDAGSFHNLTEPEDLRLFYLLKIDSKKGEGEWKECPSYSITRQNECFFNASHTFIWSYYTIQLRSRTQDFVYDEMFFSVEEIVFPDPPEGLNWSLLSMSSTGIICDVVVRWEPPPSAAENVKLGWMLLLYETQYRENGSEQWKSLDNGKNTQAYIYGLNSNTYYEVRVRCKMRGYNFGEFSDSIFILVPGKESRMPLTALFIFGAVSIGFILIMIVVSHQKKLMVIFLPPVPGPKMKGIDPVLLQGHLTEITSILGTHPGLRPELYSNDPWVEFIEVDIEEPTETMEGYDTSLHIGNSPPVSGGFRDDDSGRASCCDPDLSDHDHTNIHHSSTSGHEGFQTLSPAQPGTLRPVIIHAAGRPAWPSSLYSQVTEVTPHGVVILSPEKQNMTDDCSNQYEAPKNEKTEEERKPRLMAAPNERGYTSELDTSKINVPHTEGEHGEPSLPSTESSSSAEQRHGALQEHLSLTVEPFAFPILAMPNPPEYTMVDGVDWKNSIFLKPNKPAAPPLAVVKDPEGYLTPDLLHRITPQ